jgi:DNA helicase II / ATP-dependent DNA helicase PcrA
MRDNSAWQPDPITDSDVAWAATALGLPPTAFLGTDGRDPRGEVLKSLATMDVEACPGSGKTTLLVAKLAILARSWKSRTRGICVLSHTNVARAQIEQHLGANAVGQGLLHFPHYVGTIHAFVNEFLAMPWLRSLGYEIRAINSGMCETHRRHLLALSKYRTLASYVAGKESGGKVNFVGEWRVSDPSFVIRNANGNLSIDNQATPSAQQLAALCKQCVLDGYHCYDEMFMWGHNLLDQAPALRFAIRDRFPLLFIDEVQDNSEEQSALLHRVFMEGGLPVTCRQRFGDSNQAIYNHAGLTEGATTDRFPIAGCKRDIPTSLRFGQSIADFANPMALVPQDLKGKGPPSRPIVSDTEGKHAVYLFGDTTIAHVLPAHAAYLREVFSAEDLRHGTFTAVGAIHRHGEDKNIPRSVGNYWKDYDPAIAVSEPRPDSFLQYVAAGRKSAAASGDTVAVVDKVAQGVLRLTTIANPGASIALRKRPHRQILQLLAGNPEAHKAYIQLQTLCAIDRESPESDEWKTSWIPLLKLSALGLRATVADTGASADFLEWRRLEKHGQEPGTPTSNVFRDGTQTPEVVIRVGSIHSVKGETHTATLILDSFYVGHHLTALKPWLVGARSGRGSEGVRNASRLKLHYVAMTRPTHLLCLAMREDSLEAKDVGLLKQRHWRVGRVSASGTAWL